MTTWQPTSNGTIAYSPASPMPSEEKRIHLIVIDLLKRL